MSRLTRDELAARTLARQFPTLPGRDADAVLALFDRLGPVQSQVPRAPFLAASSRLPGVPWAVVNDLLAGHRLLKTTNLRGTVHTSTPELFGSLDAVARLQWEGRVRPALGLPPGRAAALMGAVEAFATPEWRPRAELVEHARGWLAAEEPELAARLAGLLPESLVWGHSGLLRRPRDERWDRRTDAFHRSARAVRPDLDLPSPEEALRRLVAHQLGALGPLGRADLAHLAGVGLRPVDAALASLGDAVTPCTGPDDEPLWDLAEPPAGEPPAGTRLLGEFDALVVALHPGARTRFLTAGQLARVWSKVNAQCAPMVLHGLRVVGQWRTVARGRRTDVEVTLFGGREPDDLGAAVAAAATGLGLEVTELRVVVGEP